MSFTKILRTLTVPVDVALQRVREILAAKHPRGNGMGIG